MMKGLLLIVCWTVGAWSKEMILNTDVTIECQLRDNFVVTIIVNQLHKTGGMSSIGKGETFHVANKDIVLRLSGFVNNDQDMGLMYVVQHNCVSSRHGRMALIEVTKPRQPRVNYSPTNVTVSQGTWLLNGNRIFQKEDGKLIGENLD